MNRRNFLRSLFGSAAAAATPKYFFAPIGGWKSDLIVNPNETSYNVNFVSGPPPEKTIRYRTYLVGAQALMVHPFNVTEMRADGSLPLTLRNQLRNIGPPYADRTNENF